jgi:hypothetical protein
MWLSAAVDGKGTIAELIARIRTRGNGIASKPNGIASKPDGIYRDAIPTAPYEMESASRSMATPVQSLRQQGMSAGNRE